jgi:hypothetical protein
VRTLVVDEASVLPMLAIVPPCIILRRFYTVASQNSDAIKDIPGVTYGMLLFDI